MENYLNSASSLGVSVTSRKVLLHLSVPGGSALWWLCIRTQFVLRSARRGICVQRGKVIRCWLLLFCWGQGAELAARQLQLQEAWGAEGHPPVLLAVFSPLSHVGVVVEVARLLSRRRWAPVLRDTGIWQGNGAVSMATFQQRDITSTVTCKLCKAFWISGLHNFGGVRLGLGSNQHLRSHVNYIS